MASHLKLSECMCPICMCILIEPVTMPCRHELCYACFSTHLHDTSNHCPLCRTRIASWARRNARQGTLVNQDRWHEIREAFPKRVENRLQGREDDASIEGEEEEEDLSRYMTPVAEPGAIGQEFRAAVAKMTEERKREAVAEEAASQQLIDQMSQAEQQAQIQRLKQLQDDEQLAKQLATYQTPPEKVPPIKRMFQNQAHKTPTSAKKNRLSNSSLSSANQNQDNILVSDKTPDRKLADKRGTKSRDSLGALANFIYISDQPVGATPVENKKPVSAIWSKPPKVPPTSSQSRPASGQLGEWLNRKSTKKKAVFSEIASSSNVIGLDGSTSEDSISIELNHFRPVRTFPKTPPKQSKHGRAQESVVIETTPKKLSFQECESQNNVKDPLDVMARGAYMKKRLEELKQERIKHVRRLSKGTSMEHSSSNDSSGTDSTFENPSRAGRRFPTLPLFPVDLDFNQSYSSMDSVTSYSIKDSDNCLSNDSSEPSNQDCSRSNGYNIHSNQVNDSYSQESTKSSANGSDSALKTNSLDTTYISNSSNNRTPGDRDFDSVTMDHSGSGRDSSSDQRAASCYITMVEPPTRDDTNSSPLDEKEFSRASKSNAQKSNKFSKDKKSDEDESKISFQAAKYTCTYDSETDVTIDSDSNRLCIQEESVDSLRHLSANQISPYKRRKGSANYERKERKLDLLSALSEDDSDYDVRVSAASIITPREKPTSSVLKQIALKDDDVLMTRVADSTKLGQGDLEVTEVIEVTSDVTQSSSEATCENDVIRTFIRNCTAIKRLETSYDVTMSDTPSNVATSDHVFCDEDSVFGLGIRSRIGSALSTKEESKLEPCGEHTTMGDNEEISCSRENDLQEHNTVTEINENTTMSGITVSGTKQDEEATRNDTSKDLALVDDVTMARSDAARSADLCEISRDSSSTPHCDVIADKLHDFFDSIKSHHSNNNFDTIKVAPIEESKFEQQLMKSESKSHSSNAGYDNSEVYKCQGQSSQSKTIEIHGFETVSSSQTQEAKIDDNVIEGLRCTDSITQKDAEISHSPLENTLDNNSLGTLESKRRKQDLESNSASGFKGKNEAPIFDDEFSNSSISELSPTCPTLTPQKCSQRRISQRSCTKLSQNCPSSIPKLTPQTTPKRKLFAKSLSNVGEENTVNDDTAELTDFDLTPVRRRKRHIASCRDKIVQENSVSSPKVRKFSSRNVDENKNSLHETEKFSLSKKPSKHGTRKSPRKNKTKLLPDKPTACTMQNRANSVDCNSELMDTNNCNSNALSEKYANMETDQDTTKAVKNSHSPTKPHAKSCTRNAETKTGGRRLSPRKHKSTQEKPHSKSSVQTKLSFVKSKESNPHGHVDICPNSDTAKNSEKRRSKPRSKCDLNQKSKPSRLKEKGDSDTLTQISRLSLKDSRESSSSSLQDSNPNPTQHNPSRQETVSCKKGTNSKLHSIFNKQSSKNSTSSKISVAKCENILKKSNTKCENIHEKSSDLVKRSRSEFKSESDYLAYVEEQDRLLALELQREFDLESRYKWTAIRRKNSQDEYKLRSKSRDLVGD